MIKALPMADTSQNLSEPLSYGIIKQIHMDSKKKKSFSLDYEQRSASASAFPTRQRNQADKAQNEMDGLCEREIKVAGERERSKRSRAASLRSSHTKRLDQTPELEDLRVRSKSPDLSTSQFTDRKQGPKFSSIGSTVVIPMSPRASDATNDLEEEILQAKAEPPKQIISINRCTAPNALEMAIGGPIVPIPLQRVKETTFTPKLVAPRPRKTVNAEVVRPGTPLKSFSNQQPVWLPKLNLAALSEDTDSASIASPDRSRSVTNILSPRSAFSPRMSPRSTFSPRMSSPSVSSSSSTSTQPPTTH